MILDRDAVVDRVNKVEARAVAVQSDGAGMDLSFEKW
ncbi:hypothetical protein GGE67_003835 [Rhizobium leucaenae]|uniref:Uncharacterized protein n=1 Tax=Rhizobium leucaenae TaxID=29450 RepID=A0A7W6ZSY8_9HYPH|nr:hypothetical protein [Rhizobium leucaenae]MBB6303206.1 hypothetical protein [Rhizobium leucaenae]